MFLLLNFKWLYGEKNKQNLNLSTQASLFCAVLKWTFYAVQSYWLALLFVTSRLPKQVVVTQDSLNDIMGLMSFNWEKILTCRPNCIWLKTILVLLLANWLGRLGKRVLDGSVVSLWKYCTYPQNGLEAMEHKAKAEPGEQTLSLQWWYNRGMLQREWRKRDKTSRTED